MPQSPMVAYTDILEGPAKVSNGSYESFYITHCSRANFATFDATYKKIGDVLHQFDSFSETSKTRIKDVVIIFWIIGMRIFENMKMYKKN